MVTFRTAIVGGCLVLAVLPAAACAQVNEVISGRDLECVEVPEDICASLADDIVARWVEPERLPKHGPFVRFWVHPLECDLLFEPADPAVAGCWQVEAYFGVRADGSDPIDAAEAAYQSLDGILFELEDHRVIGTFPVQ